MIAGAGFAGFPPATGVQGGGNLVVISPVVPQGQDDSPVINAAIAAGTDFIIPRRPGGGNWMVTPGAVNFNVPNQTVTIANGAVIQKLPVATAGPVFTVSAAGVTITGGAVDGNLIAVLAAGSTGGSPGILVTAPDTIIIGTGANNNNGAGFDANGASAHLTCLGCTANGYTAMTYVTVTVAQGTPVGGATTTSVATTQSPVTAGFPSVGAFSVMTATGWPLATGANYSVYQYSAISGAGFTIPVSQGPATFVDSQGGTATIAQCSPAVAQQNGFRATNGGVMWTDGNCLAVNNANDGFLVTATAGTANSQTNQPFGSIINGRSSYSLGIGFEFLVSDVASSAIFSQNDCVYGVGIGTTGTFTALITDINLGLIEVDSIGRYYANKLGAAEFWSGCQVTYGKIVNLQPQGYGLEILGLGTYGSSTVTGGSFSQHGGVNPAMYIGQNVNFYPAAIDVDGAIQGGQFGGDAPAQTPANIICNDANFANCATGAFQLRGCAGSILRGTISNCGNGSVAFNLGMVTLTGCGPGIGTHAPITVTATAPGGVGTTLINDATATLAYLGGQLTAVGLGAGGASGTATIITPIVPGASYTISTVTTGTLTGAGNGSVAYDLCQNNYADFIVTNVPAGTNYAIYVGTNTGTPPPPVGNVVNLWMDNNSWSTVGHVINDNSGGLNTLNVATFTNSYYGVGGNFSFPYEISAPQVVGTSSGQLTAQGIVGATNSMIYSSATAGGAPVSGTWAYNTVVGDSTGKLWYCTVGGTPGTWVQIGGSGSALLTQINGTTSGPIAAANGDIVNTTGAATVTLPAAPVLGSAVLVNRGNHVAAITITANTGQKINGGTAGGFVTMGASGAIANADSILFVAQSATAWTMIASNNDGGLGVQFGGNLQVAGTTVLSGAATAAANFTMSGRVTISRTNTAVNYTVAATDLWVNATAACTITLTQAGQPRLYFITNSSTGVVVLTPTSGNLDGLTTNRDLPIGQTVAVLTDGTNYWTSLPGPPTATATYAVTTATGGVQNTTGRDLLVSFVFQVTSATSGATLTYGVGPAATPTQVAFVTLPTLVGVLDNYSACARVPAGYYLALGTTGTVVVSSVSGVAT